MKDRPLAKPSVGFSEVSFIMLIRPNRFYEDIEVGEFCRSRPRKIREEEILRFSQEYDPQWFHCEPEKAKVSIFGGVVASGIHTAALWRQMNHEINGDIAFACGLGWDEVRWRRALRPGDVIHAESKLLEKRVSASRTDRGYCRFESSVRLEDGAALLTFFGTSVIYTRASKASTAFGV